MYTSQEPWICNATLRQNIVMGREMDGERYERCLDACALRPDIAELTGGDSAEIGEKGVNLSGGQKARVSLARACYSSAHESAAASFHVLDAGISCFQNVPRNEKQSS